MAALRYILLAAAITLTLALLAHLVLPARGPIPRRTGRRGGLGIAALTAVYAVAAFFGLGSARDPQQFCSFEAGESAVLALERESEISAVWYYPGLSTGEYTLAYSADGVTFTPAGTMPQGYADLFKWLQPEMADTAPAAAAYVRITASAHMELGELALYDPQGSRIGVRAITGPASADALCDEADTVPAASTYYNSTYFDEIYHARTAYEHLRGVYPYEVSHPPLGKEILSLGIVLFGMTPFGWRFMGTLFGVAMLPLMWDLLRRMFRDDRVALCGAALLAFDFMHLTQTRIATIDSFATFFILLMYLFLYRYFTEGRLRHLAACGVTFGIGAATKWTCLYAGAGLGVLWALHWIFAGVQAHRDGDGRRYAHRLLGNIGFCLVFLVLVPGMIYYASYYPYGAARGLHGHVLHARIRRHRAGKPALHVYLSFRPCRHASVFLALVAVAARPAADPLLPVVWRRDGVDHRLVRQSPAVLGRAAGAAGARIPRGEARPHGAVSPRRLSGAGVAVGVHLTPDVRIPLLRGDALSRARARVRVRPAAAARLSRHRVCLHGGKRRALRAVFPRAHGRDDPARLCMECAQMAPGLAVLTPGKLQKSRYCL